MLSKRFNDGCLRPFFVTLFVFPCILILLREKISNVKWEGGGGGKVITNYRLKTKVDNILRDLHKFKKLFYYSFKILLSS